MERTGYSALLYGLAIFLVGMLAGYMVSSWDQSVTGLAVSDLAAPSDYLDSHGIYIYQDKVTLDIEGAQLSHYDSTGSMLPTLSERVNGVTVAPESPDDISVGDIVSFRRNGELIVHRVIEKGTDAEGTYFVTKGDNAVSDDGKIRFGQIERKIVAIVY